MGPPVDVPTRRVTGKKPEPKAVVKSILKKPGSKADKSKKVQIPPKEQHVTASGKNAKKVPLEKKPGKISKAKEEIEKSLQQEALRKKQEKEKEKEKTRKAAEKAGSKMGKESKDKKSAKESKEDRVAKQDGKEQGKKEEKVDYGKKNSVPVKYHPCKRGEVEALFRTPSPKRRGSSLSDTSRRTSSTGTSAAMKAMKAFLED